MSLKQKKGLFFLLLLLIFNFFSWSLLFYLRESVLRVVFFDVGQGDAIFIRTPQNHHILIDGGPEDFVLEGLANEMPFFYNQIDLVILSHAHDDHVSGIIEVLKHHKVKDILCTGAVGDSAVSKKWKEIIKKRGYRQIRAGKKISAGDFYIEALYPLEDLRGVKVNDLNTVSGVFRLVFKDKHSFLFTGDAYKKQEKEVLAHFREKVEADVLKVGHHGSRTSTDKDFLKAVSPQVAVIMAGEDNRYGHPHREVVEKLQRFDIKVMKTSKDGDIIFTMH
jgi:competence protein ComEC